MAVHAPRVKPSVAGPIPAPPSSVPWGWTDRPQEVPIMRRVRPESPSQQKAAEAARRAEVIAAADTLLASIDELLAEPTPALVHR